MSSYIAFFENSDTIYSIVKQVPISTFIWKTVTAESYGLSEESQENPDVLALVAKCDLEK